MYVSISDRINYNVSTYCKYVGMYVHIYVCIYIYTYICICVCNICIYIGM